MIATQGREDRIDSSELREELANRLDAACTDKIVCACFGITESMIVDAVAACNLSTVNDLCRQTNAGAGCTACRQRLKTYILQSRQTICAMS